ncbi:hypothetical protein Tco_1019202 [Tanacetum coccineum]|uniref:Uncharacterized protein n=1 Tax=Tanacetum coccineum TaxID=301880 RepID=A0ABQ5FYC8_9ASTR
MHLLTNIPSQTHIHRDPNRGRRRAANRYRFSKEVRTEVDEEQQTNTYSTTERSAQRLTKSRSGRCITQNHINTEMNENRPDMCIAQKHINTEMNESRLGRHQITDSNISRQTTKNSDRQQTRYTDNKFRQSSRSDNKFPSRYRQTKAEPEPNSIICRTSGRTRQN